MISAVVLTRNDEEHLPKALESLRWCDEIIVVDDNSVDKTVQIAKKYKTRVYVRSLDRDFASQRNFGLSKARYPWVLFVDSDEVVSEELKEEIQKVASNQSSVTSNSVGFYIKRVDWMWGRELKHGETGHIYLLRLAKKGSGLWKEPVHETWNISGNTARLSHALLHYPHPDVAQFLDTIHTYSTLRARYLYASHIHARGWHIVVYPVAKFLKNYIGLLGFLDGMPGLLVAVMMSFHSFLVRSKLYLLYYKKEVPFNK